jgi:hypothetical protein
MAGCNEAKKAECRALGKVCNPKSGRCKEPAKGGKKAKSASPMNVDRTAKRKRSGSASSSSAAAKRRKMSPAARVRSAARVPLPSTSLVAGAVLDQVGPATQASLVHKGHSQKLGAGLPTLVDMTKDKVRKTRSNKGVRRASGALSNAGGLQVNWSGAGVPHRLGSQARVARRGRHHAAGGKRKAHKAHKASGRAHYHTGEFNFGGAGLPRHGGASCGKPCKKAGQIRSTVAPCRCLKPSGAAAKAQGICPVRKGKDGKEYHTVLVTSADGKRRCVKAGGAAAKQHLKGNAACPPGKVLKSYTATIRGVRVPAKRCVFPQTKEAKKCPVNQVLAQKTTMGHGHFAGERVTVVRCVLPKTAAKKNSGWTVLSQGTQPMRRVVPGVRTGRKHLVAVSTGY